MIRALLFPSSTFLQLPSPERLPGTGEDGRTARNIGQACSAFSQGIEQSAQTERRAEVQSVQSILTAGTSSISTSVRGEDGEGHGVSISVLRSLNCAADAAASVDDVSPRQIEARPTDRPSTGPCALSGDGDGDGRRISIHSKRRAAAAAAANIGRG